MWLEAVLGTAILRRCPLSSDVCLQWLLHGYSGRLFWGTGLFSLCFGKRLLNRPGDGRLLRASALKLTSFVTFHFFPRLQLPALLSANKRCQVKLGESRGEESPGIFWGAFFPQEAFLAASVFVSLLCALRRPKKRDQPANCRG